MDIRLNQMVSNTQVQPMSSSPAARGGGFRGRGRFTRGRGAAKAFLKRRGGTRRFNRGRGAKNSDPEKFRADLDKQLNEYMEGTNGN